MVHLEPRYRWEWRTYQRSLRPPLHTQHGLWSVREGILLRLTDEQGRVGYGEIAPIAWFGSETLAQAVEFCQSLPAAIAQAEIEAIPASLPACQFGFESAWVAIAGVPAMPQLGPERLCALLPTGPGALQAWSDLWAQGFRTFKWKIGVAAIAQELAWFDQLLAALPEGTTLRLDANGGLSLGAAKTWCDAAQGTAVEFLEQPLSPELVEPLLELQATSPTAIALDEAVATLAQLQTWYDRGWQGVWVIKPAIAGSPRRLRQFCQTPALDIVFSSALETEIGRRAGLRLALECGKGDRALGYGTQHWFQAGAETSGMSEGALFEQLWQTL